MSSKQFQRGSRQTSQVILKSFQIVSLDSLKGIPKSPLDTPKAVAIDPLGSPKGSPDRSSRQPKRDSRWSPQRVPKGVQRVHLGTSKEISDRLPRQLQRNPKQTPRQPQRGPRWIPRQLQREPRQSSLIALTGTKRASQVEHVGFGSEISELSGSGSGADLKNFADRTRSKKNLVQIIIFSEFFLIIDNVRTVKQNK